MSLPVWPGTKRRRECSQRIEAMRNFYPLRSFILYFLPGAFFAVLLGLLAMPSAPGLAPTLLLSFGFLAYALAVGSATSPSGPFRSGSDRAGPVLAILALRRNRCRYAFVFALAAAGFGAMAQQVAKAVGMPLPVVVNAGHLALTLAVLFIAAWVQIGEAACSQGAIRRALLGNRDET